MDMRKVTVAVVTQYKAEPVVHVFDNRETALTGLMRCIGTSSQERKLLARLRQIIGELNEQIGDLHITLHDEKVVTQDVER
jgi:hypothetical protein